MTFTSDLPMADTFGSGSPQVVALVMPLPFGWHSSSDLDHLEPFKFMIFLTIIFEFLELNVDDGPCLVKFYVLLTSSQKWKVVEVLT